MKEVVVFTSPTCGPCKRLKPTIAAIHEQRGFPLRILEISDETAAEFVKFEIRAVPVVICLEDGKEVGRFAGGQPAPVIEKHLASWGF